MNESEFESRAGEALRKLESALRDAADELEVDLADGILTVEFDDGSKFLANSHSASQQIWLSANLAAWHFAWHEATASWRDTKSGEELFTQLGLLVSQKLAQPVKLRS
jgi:iron-sulfur cluster assembly protein CyaY